MILEVDPPWVSLEMATACLTPDYNLQVDPKTEGHRNWGISRQCPIYKGAQVDTGAYEETQSHVLGELSLSFNPLPLHPPSLYSGESRLLCISWTVSLQAHDSRS